MTLYEMLDIALHHQKIRIYEANIYGQNMSIYKDEVGDARRDGEGV